MEDIIGISLSSKNISGTIELPGSKSESNRALIIDSLTGNQCSLINLSLSEDTLVMQKSLTSDASVIDTGNAGTVMRFLTAYFAAMSKDKILTGNERMLERPVGPIVDALNELGADITYLNKPGYPPVKINGSVFTIPSNKIRIMGNISSQFVSALLMIAPTLPTGIEIELEGGIASKPYIEMTLQLMRHFGIVSKWEGNFIRVEKQDYIPTQYTIEGDWSCASYWYAMVASADDAGLFLKGLRRKSFQGDAVLEECFKPFGVITEYSDAGAFITKGETDVLKIPRLIDFTDHPDLAQTMMVLCAAKGLKCKFTGMESLRIKETDRIEAMQRELGKFNVKLVEETKGVFVLEGNFNKNASPIIETYNDHRMAMAFAVLSFYCKEVKIKNPDCVRKSYPGFWKDIELVMSYKL
jgi:3-phosphoshikimate 1-carboxyvinyltransferase